MNLGRGAHPPPEDPDHQQTSKLDPKVVISSLLSFLLLSLSLTL